MPKPLSRMIEIHYENKLEKALKEIKTAASSTEKTKAENSFFDLLCEISTNYSEAKSKRLVQKYNSLYEDYRQEQEIKRRESD